MTGVDVGPAPPYVGGLPPRYLDGTLADVLPAAVIALAGADRTPWLVDRLGLVPSLRGKRRIAVLLLDGMGWHQLPLMAPIAPTIAGALDGSFGSAIRTTCGFPSTTPTSLVSLATGAWPGAHGVLAFNTHVPGTGIVLNHTQWIDFPPPREWQPVPPIWAAAAAAGITGTVVNRAEYLGGGLTESTARGATFQPASGVDELAAAMLAALWESPAPALVYGYHPELDKAGHEHGVDSVRWRAAAADIERLLSRLTADLPADAALLVTADHGQLNVPMDHRIELSEQPRLLAGVRLLAGEPRVRYLHTEPGATADVLAAWRALAGHAAWVGTRAEAVATGWYGPMPAEHAARLGDVVAICRDDWAIFSVRHESPHLSKLVALHGSLTPAEMEIPVLVFA
jgi:hypothetical protein